MVSLQLWEGDGEELRAGGGTNPPKEMSSPQTPSLRGTEGGGGFLTSLCVLDSALYINSHGKSRDVLNDL